MSSNEKNKNEKAVLFKELKLLAAILSADVTKEVMQAYVEILSRYDFELSKKAISWASTNCKFFPKPVELIERINPKATKEDADFIAGEIFAAIRNFGYYQGKLAKKNLCSEAWKAIEFCGGWSYLCNSSSQNLNIIKAQLRDAISSGFVKDEIAERRKLRQEHNQLAEKLKITDQNIAKDKVALEIIGFDRMKKQAIENFKKSIKEEKDITC